VKNKLTLIVINRGEH